MIGLPNLGNVSLRALLLQSCQAAKRNVQSMCSQPACGCQQECSTSENLCLAVLTRLPVRSLADAFADQIRDTPRRGVASHLANGERPG
jgi:hypothetical protein